jgi:hypothetical protein
LIIEKADRGSSDYAMHAIELFLDLLSIFVRLVLILLKNSQKSKDDEEEEEKNKRRR